MRRISILTALWCGLQASVGFAQTTTTAPTSTPTPQQQTSRLTGTILDAATKQPVAFATVAVLPPTGDKPLAGAACDEQGRFVLTGIPVGSHRLLISFVGYTTRTEPVTVGTTAKDLGQLLLTSETKQLAGVTVTGEKALVETRPDRIIYNAEADATNAGGTASDVLRKTPLLSVDVNGNVSLRGSTNLRVLINNKPSAILANNLAEALKQIPSDQIKSVEVMTTPPAKYDAEGTGGVVNIVLKKNTLEGVNGRIGASAGNRNQGLNGALNVQRSKFGFNSNLSTFFGQYPGRNSSTRTDYTSQGIGQLTQRSESSSRSSGAFGQVGFTYDPSPQHSFAVNLDGNTYNWRNPQNLFNQYSGIPALDTLYVRDINQDNPSRNYDVNASYTRTFKDKPRREWSMLAQQSISRSNQHYSLEQYNTADLSIPGPLEYREQSENLSRNREATLQTDYIHPFGDKTTLETGAKAILRRVSSDYELDTLLLSQQNDFARSARRSNAFDYRQNVGAAYASLGFGLGKKYKFSLGTRAEYTDLQGQFSGQGDAFRNHYLNVLPTLSTTRTLKKEGQTLGLTYTRRIQRPQIYFLNPYVNQQDPRNISYGNPELRPELTENLDVSYNTFSEKTTLNLSLYGRRTNNSIEQVRFYNETLGRAESTFQNIASSTTVGSSAYTSWRPSKGVQVGGNLNLYYTRLRSPVLNRTNSRFVYNVSLNSSYKFMEKYTAQFYGGYYAGSVQLQTRSSGYYYYSLALKRTFFKEKADLTLSANTFLQNTIRFRSTTVTDQFTSTNEYFSYQRSLRLAFNYRFGKAGQPQRQRRTIQNNDTKGGGGGQQGG